MWWAVGGRESQREVHRKRSVKGYEEQANVGGLFTSQGHGLLPRAMSGSEALLQLGTVLMFMHLLQSRVMLMSSIWEPTRAMLHHQGYPEARVVPVSVSFEAIMASGLGCF